MLRPTIIKKQVKGYIINLVLSFFISLSLFINNDNNMF